MSTRKVYRYNDAMQLMIDDEISLNKHGKKWRASKMFLINGKLEWRNIKSFIVIHENPCRAIAECYLLMKEDENNNGK